MKLDLLPHNRFPEKEGELALQATLTQYCLYAPLSGFSAFSFSSHVTSCFFRDFFLHVFFSLWWLI